MPRAPIGALGAWLFVNNSLSREEYAYPIFGEVEKAVSADRSDSNLQLMPL